MNLKSSLAVRLALVALSATLFGACASAPAPVVTEPVVTEPAPEVVAEKPTPIRIDIVATSDTHGWAAPHEDKLPNGNVIQTGGLAAFAGYVNILREQLPDGVVLVDAGDAFQGTLLSNLFEGKSVVEAMNLLAYDSMTAGNHEFDYGPVGPKALVSQPDEDPLGALKAYTSVAKFPLLARNVVVKGTDSRPEGFHPEGFIIIERQGIKIGILGLATPDTLSASNPVNLKDLDFRDVVPSALEGVQAMKAAGAQVLIGVIHEGNRCRDLSDPNDISSCDGDTGLIHIAQQLPTGLFHGLIGGHSHANVGHMVNGMPLVQSGAQARAFGLLELTIDPETKQVLTDATKIRSSIDICNTVYEGTNSCSPKAYQEGVNMVAPTFEGKTVVSDEAIAQLIQGYADQVAQKKAESLKVTIQKPMHREYKSECPLGNALSDVLREYTKADFAILNSGGLRTDMPQGELTYGTLYNILPFDNYTATLKLSGAQVVKIFETLLSSQHGVPQISGMKLTVEMCSDGAHVLKATDAKGRALDLRANSKKLYTLVTSDFLASGGDGLTDFLKSLPEGRIDVGATRDMNMRDEIAGHILKKGMKEPGIQGRLTIVPCKDTSKAADIQGKRH